MDRSFGHVKRFCRCVTDHGYLKRVEDPLPDRMCQRIYGLALGYEDLNDHEQLKSGPLLATLCCKRDSQDRERLGEQDRRNALAAKSTLNRLELTSADAAASQRYQKIMGYETVSVAEGKAVRDRLVKDYEAEREMSDQLLVPRDG